MVLVGRDIAVHADQPGELVQEDVSHPRWYLHVVVMVTVMVDLQNDDAHGERDADEHVRVRHVVNWQKQKKKDAACTISNKNSCFDYRCVCLFSGCQSSCSADVVENKLVDLT